jgi:hypothetical protein
MGLTSDSSGKTVPGAAAGTVQDEVPLIHECLEMILDRVTACIGDPGSLRDVIRPCSRANSSNVTDNSGMSARIIRSRSIFFSSRLFCRCSALKKNSIQGFQSGSALRIVPCVRRSEM